MGEALLKVKNLNAWYNDAQMILSDLSLELDEQDRKSTRLNSSHA